MSTLKNKTIKVAVGMSGGVDSSVAALLLKEQGFDVVGLFMKFWHDDSCDITRENSCCDEKSLAMARKVAEKLEIPFYVVDAREQFKQDVTDYYLNEYKAMRTPNPCVVCNQKIKFGWMLDFAKKIGCEYVATGHYARIVNPKSEIRNPKQIQNDKFSNDQINDQCKMNNEKYHLLRGVDEKKDQSYFLYRLNQEQLSHIIFPLEEMTKDEVRALAKKADLPVADRSESQEICFIQDKDYREFLKRYLPAEYFKPGRIVDADGFTVGQHDGLVNYTIGQRKGISQNSGFRIQNSAESRPLYVIGFHVEKNEVIVGEDSELFKSEAVVEQVSFVSGIKYQVPDKKLQVKIRYGAEAVDCVLKPKIPDTPLRQGYAGQAKYQILLKSKIRAITPGQSAVFYDGDEVVGGGIIS